MSGLSFGGAPRPKGIRCRTSASFFVPDSLPYDRASLGDATLTVSVVLQASGETGATDDPSGVPTWIQVHVNGHLGWPAGVGYRVVALTPPDAVR